MKKLYRIPVALLTLLMLCAIAPTAFARQCEPVSVKRGLGGVKLELYGLYRDGSVNRSDRHADITGVSLSDGSIAEVYEERGMVFVRGLAEGSTQFTATTASGETFTGLLIVYDWDNQPEAQTFERGQHSIVLPPKMQMFVGETITYYNKAVAWKVMDPGVVSLNANRDRMNLRAVAAGTTTLFAMDRYSGDVAQVELEVNDLEVLAGFKDGAPSITLRVGEASKALAAFPYELSERQMRGIEWRIIGGPTSVIELESSSGVVVARRPGTAKIGLYVPLTQRVYGAHDGSLLTVEVLAE